MIYVDEPRRYETPLRYKVWSHMWSDECDQELHEMADKIGLRREWFQEARANATSKFKRYYNHYDVTPAKRELALRLGATALTTLEYLEKVKGTDADPVKWSAARNWEGIHERTENALDYYGDPDRYGNS